MKSILKIALLTLLTLIIIIIIIIIIRGNYLKPTVIRPVFTLPTVIQNLILYPLEVTSVKDLLHTSPFVVRKTYC